MPEAPIKAATSYNMSRIRSKDTKPEMLVRKFLHANGYRYRLHRKDLPGRPDIVLPKYKTAIFINGCFWHGHEPCKYYSVPKTRTAWWLNKINTNRLKDQKNLAALDAAGWQTITIWECNLKPSQRDFTFALLLNRLR